MYLGSHGYMVQEHAGESVAACNVNAEIAKRKQAEQKELDKDMDDALDMARLIIRRRSRRNKVA